MQLRCPCLNNFNLLAKEIAEIAKSPIRRVKMHCIILKTNITRCMSFLQCCVLVLDLCPIILCKKCIMASKSCFRVIFENDFFEFVLRLTHIYHRAGRV